MSERDYGQDIWEMLTAQRFQKYWWTMTIILIIIIIVVKYLDYKYPPSVCFCDENDIILSHELIIIKRWGALEDCVKLCDDKGLKLVKEVNYSEYVNFINYHNKLVMSFANLSSDVSVI